MTTKEYKKNNSQSNVYILIYFTIMVALGTIVAL